MPRPAWSDRALDDLEELRRYIAADRPSVALRVFIRIVEHVNLLGEQPFLGRSGRAPGTRELVVPGTPYIVVYSVAEGTVRVHAIYHAARRWPDSF